MTARERPDLVPHARRALAKSLRKSAARRLHAEGPAAALPDLERSLELDPRNPRALVLRWQVRRTPTATEETVA